MSACLSGRNLIIRESFMQCIVEQLFVHDSIHKIGGALMPGWGRKGGGDWTLLLRLYFYPGLTYLREMEQPR